MAEKIITKKIDKIAFGYDIEVTEEKPTIEQIENWTAADLVTGPCGPWTVLVNPNKQSRYKVAYMHFHNVAGEMVLVKYGFLDGNGAKHFVLEGAIWIKSPYPMLSAEAVMREYLPVKGIEA